MTKTSKRYIAALAGLLILLYHCWIPVFKYGTVVGSVTSAVSASSRPAASFAIAMLVQASLVGEM